MLRFEPPELQQQLANALKKLADVFSIHDWYPIDEEGFDPAGPDYAEDDTTITADTEVQCNLSSDDSGNDTPITAGDLVRWADWLEKYQLKNRTVLRLDGKTFVYAHADGPEEHALAEHIQAGNASVTQQTKVDGEEYSVKLVAGFTPFAIFIEAEGKSDRDYGISAYYPTTTYVEVDHPPAAKEERVLELVRSFLFELAATASRYFEIAAYPGLDDVKIYESSKHEEVTLRPLHIGRGLSDLHQLFVAGCRANPEEYALIHFVKVIEYVSATVIRQGRHEALRKRLSSSAALAPDAQFLDDLAKLIEDHRAYRQDSEALKLTLQTCCDPVLLAKEAPACVDQLRKLQESDDPRAKRAAIDKLSATLSATRNQLSHAKANYALTGEECPADQSPKLTATAKAAAEQVIRWFASLPESSRVV